METGIIDSPATSQKQEKYFSHPDTGVKILGQSIPRWKELMQLVEELVRVVPEQKQVGWDFALTNQGWIVVEGNDRPGIQRLVPNRGLRTVMQCMYDAYHE
jgi:D-alanine-D-alanine ligase-like ATP-grasp enzyme